MIPVLKRKMDEQQVVNLAGKILLDSWHIDNSFKHLTVYSASVTDADNVFVVRVAKEEREGKDSPARRAYGLSVYMQHRHANGDTDDVFVGGVSNNDQAMRIFRALDLRGLRREMFT